MASNETKNPQTKFLLPTYSTWSASWFQVFQGSSTVFVDRCYNVDYKCRISVSFTTKTQVNMEENSVNFAKLARLLAFIHIITGVLLLVFGIADKLVQYKRQQESWVDCYGIWTGIWVSNIFSLVMSSWRNYVFEKHQRRTIFRTVKHANVSRVGLDWPFSRYRWIVRLRRVTRWIIRWNGFNFGWTILNGLN